MKQLKNKAGDLNYRIRTIQHRINFVNTDTRQKLLERLDYLKEDRNNIFLKIQELKKFIEGILF